MEIQQFIRTLTRWWWLIIAGTLAASVISYFATRATPNTYLSQTTLLVGQPFTDASANDIFTSQTLADVYAGLALREPVLGGTLRELKLEWGWEVLRDRVTTRVPPSSPLIEISVVDTDPTRAQAFANTIAQQVQLQSPAARNQDSAQAEFSRVQLDDLKRKIEAGQVQIRTLDDEVGRANSKREIDEKRGRIDALQTQITQWQTTFANLQRNLMQGSPSVITVIERASLPTVPIGPRMTQNVALATLVGLIVSLLVAFVLEVIDDTLKSTDDVRRITGLPVLGAVTSIRGSGYPSKLVALNAGASRAAEAFRVLRTNLQFASTDKPFRTLMLTSTRPREGKSVMTANLAAVIAQAGHKTLLIDCDLRRPTQHTIFETGNERGVMTLFLDEKIQPQDLPVKVSPNLSLLTSGPMPPNPAELLDSVRMTRVLEQYKALYDLIVIDVPPVLSVADTSILAAKVDAVIMVVDSGYTRRAHVKRSIEALTSVGANLLGVVVNRVSERGDDAYYYYSNNTQSGGGRPGGKKSRGLVELLQPQRRPALPDAAAPATNASSKLKRK
jgi:polysaccharide biosynthesis transport protein